jgi:hypothetical protein
MILKAQIRDLGGTVLKSWNIYLKVVFFEVLILVKA